MITEVISGANPDFQGGGTSTSELEQGTGEKVEDIFVVNGEFSLGS